MLFASESPVRSGRVSNSVLVVLVCILSGWFLYDRAWPLFSPAAALPRPVDPRGSLTEQELTTTQIFERVSPSVVFVTSERAVPTFFGDTLQRGSGSGIVWDQQGHIVTNFHVVAEARNLTVTLADGSVWEATPIGGSERKDIAVLKIDAPASQLVPVPVGTSSDLKVGQSTFAIGNPFGLDQTLTTGIISALHRQIQTENGIILDELIQTDASINPGNSGGALLDSAGRLIGMNTAILSPSRTSAGIGFAVPVDTVNLLVPQLITHGREILPQMGVSLYPVRFRSGVAGLMVTNVMPGSAAERAGFIPLKQTGRRGENRPGDVIIRVNGNPVPDFVTYQNIIEDYKVGDTITVTVLRDGQELDVKVTLESPTGD